MSHASSANVFTHFCLDTIIVQKYINLRVAHRLKFIRVRLPYNLAPMVMLIMCSLLERTLLYMCILLYSMDVCIPRLLMFPAF